jgi:lipid-binding SYLF domain-containing protein
MALWWMQHSLNLTLPGDRFEYAFVQGRAGGDSLLLVWQTGMGLFLGFALDGEQFAEQREKTETSTPG